MFKKYILTALPIRRRTSAAPAESGNVALPVGALVMVLVVALASLGVAYGLWSKVLTIQGTVATGRVHAMFVSAFTDDDDTVNDPAKDSGDLDNCQDLGKVDRNGNGLTSCDPAASGRDPKPRHDKDVARCDAAIVGDREVATVTKTNVYPGYFCTAWFDVVNDGSIPVQIVSTTVNGVPVIPSRPTAFDLDGDGNRDVTIHVTGIRLCQQIDPDEIVQMDIDQRVLQDAPQGGTLRYIVQVQLNQWNEGCSDRIIDADGTATAGDGIPGAVEVTPGTALTSWPTGFSVEGIDMFDTDGNGAWTFGPGGDDLHVEGSAYPGAIRDGLHQDSDPVVLDINGSLAGAPVEPVSCDFEVGAFCPPTLPGLIKFHDLNGNGNWDDGEDIVLDLNGNGVFD